MALRRLGLGRQSRHRVHVHQTGSLCLGRDEAERLLETTMPQRIA
jgi:hypothetical protein